VVAVRRDLTHIGIIRALEENNIPIDYITGTSMGAIIGALYAMGYSPDDMEELLKSDDFKRWYSGEIEQKYVYYFKKDLAYTRFYQYPIITCKTAKDKTSFSAQVW
jgi:NTE family protein